MERDNKKSLLVAKHLIDQAAAQLEPINCQECNRQVTLNLLRHCSEKIDKMLIVGDGTESYKERDND